MADHRAPRGSQHGAGPWGSGALDPDGPDIPAPDGPVDLAALHADDALLDALRTAPRSADPCVPTTPLATWPGSDDDRRLAEVLAGWRADVEADPIPELVTLDEAVAAVRAGQAPAEPLGRPGTPGRPSLRRRLPFTVAAAAALVGVLGFGTMVHQAMPGEALWGVSQVVFSSRAESVQKAEEARTAIEQADAAIRENDLPRARSLLQTANAQIDGVRADDRAPLIAAQDQVQRSLAPSAPATTPTDPTTSTTSGSPVLPPVTSSTTTTTTSSSSTTPKPSGVLPPGLLPTLLPPIPPSTTG